MCGMDMGPGEPPETRPEDAHNYAHTAQQEYQQPYDRPRRRLANVDSTRADLFVAALARKTLPRVSARVAACEAA